MTTEKKPGRGGKRSGAGAPRGNKNALSSGRYVEDKLLRRALLRVPPEEREHLLRALKKRAPLSRPAPPPAPPANVTAFPSAAAAAAEQSNAPLGGPLLQLVARLTGHSFFGALPFLRRHFPAAPSMEQALDHLDRLAVEEPAEYDKIRNKGAWLRVMFHELSAAIHEDLLYCRFCDWNQRRLFTREETG